MSELDSGRQFCTKELAERVEYLRKNHGSFSAYFAWLDRKNRRQIEARTDELLAKGQG